MTEILPKYFLTIKTSKIKIKFEHVCKCKWKSSKLLGSVLDTENNNNRSRHSICKHTEIRLQQKKPQH